jgi:hypothetical protein
MSREVKYIGMDVHKEAVGIAVLNSNGKLVMESIVETKASSILQFIHGLRGELHVTWEEGIWAAWLYDLLPPQVADGGQPAMVVPTVINISNEVGGVKVVGLFFFMISNTLFTSAHTHWFPSRE